MPCFYNYYYFMYIFLHQTYRFWIILNWFLQPVYGWFHREGSVTTVVAVWHVFVSGWMQTADDVCSGQLVVRSALLQTPCSHMQLQTRKWDVSGAEVCPPDVLHWGGSWTWQRLNIWTHQHFSDYRAFWLFLFLGAILNSYHKKDQQTMAIYSLARNYSYLLQILT